MLTHSLRFQSPSSESGQGEGGEQREEGGPSRRGTADVPRSAAGGTAEPRSRGGTAGRAQSGQTKDPQITVAHLTLGVTLVVLSVLNFKILKLPYALTCVTKKALS